MQGRLLVGKIGEDRVQIREPQALPRAWAQVDGAEFGAYKHWEARDAPRELKLLANNCGN